MRPPSDSPSQRGRIAPFLVMDVMDEAARVEGAGHAVLHLEVGQPGSPAPRAVIDAAHAALESDRLGYRLARGDRALCARIAAHYRDTYGHAVDPNAVVITTGASGALSLALLSAFSAGDRVAVTVPGYPCYRNMLHALDLTAVELRVGPKSGYQLTAQQLAQLDPAPRGLILGSPANPTGSIVPPEELARIVALCDERGIVPIVDEIYHGLTYTQQPPCSAVQLSPRAWVVNSFSKYFSMTGWRLGWMLVPEPYRISVERLTQNLFICAPALSQKAALAAFDAQEELEAHRSVYAHNRQLLLDALRRAGVTQVAPADGAFYIYADISHLTGDSPGFCAKMLKEIHVATTPGTDFDPERGHRMLRLSYCISRSEAQEAARRLERYLSHRSSREKPLQQER